MLSTSTPRATSSCPDSSTATPTSTRVWPAIAIKGCNPTNFLENLEQQWWKIDDNLTLAGTKASAYATILDSIRDGVTTIFDHHASFCEIPGSLFTIKDAAQELGMRSCLCYEVSDRRGQEKCDQAIAENAEFAQWAAKECRDNDNHMIAAMPNVGWCEAMTMLFENNVKMASKYFDRKLDVLEPGAAADVIVMDYKPFTPLSEENIDGHMLFGMMGKTAAPPSSSTAASCTRIASSLALMRTRSARGPWPSPRSSGARSTIAPTN